MWLINGASSISKIAICLWGFDSTLPAISYLIQQRTICCEIFKKNKLINGHELQASIKLLHSELKQYDPLQSSTKYTNSYFPKMFFCVHILLSRNLLSKYDIRWNVKANAWKFNPRVKGISLSSD